MFSSKIEQTVLAVIRTAKFTQFTNYMTLTTDFLPLHPALKLYFQAVINVLTKDNTIAAR
jgi:hypothetical protein